MKKVIVLFAILAVFATLPNFSYAKAEKIINGPMVESITNNAAVIAWTTNTGGSSIIKYGTDAKNLNQTAESPYADKEGAANQTHRVRLHNLQPGTTYYYTVISGQGEGSGTQAASPVKQFTTKGGKSVSASPASGGSKPQNLMIINGPVEERATSNTAVIAWTTNTGGSTIIHYGIDSNSLTQTAQSPYADTEGATYQTHRVTLRNLQPGTKYYYVVDSGQGEGTGTEIKSPVSSFTTTGGPAAAASANTVQTASRVPFYRLVSSSGDHFLTTSQPEATAASAQGYRLEGTAGYILSSPAPGAVPLYRLASNTGKAHFYTTSASERDSTITRGYHSEGIAGYIASSQLPGTTPLYRLYNSKNDDHFYTTSATERQQAIQGGYKDEGIAGYIWTAQQ